MIRYVPQDCPLSHDTVPAEIVRRIESLVSAQSPHTRGTRASAADIADALGREVETSSLLVRLIDTLDPKYRPMVLLHRGDEVAGIPTIWLLGWSTSQGTDIHDHATSEVGIYVLRGQVRERVFACAGNCDLHDMKPGFSTPALVHERTLRQGSSLELYAPYIHEVFGRGTDAQRDVTVHAYFPPLTRMAYFDFDGNALRCKDVWEGKCPG